MTWFSRKGSPVDDRERIRAKERQLRCVDAEIPCEEKSFKNKTKWTGTLASYQVND
jgi:hypothetical protein